MKFTLGWLKTHLETEASLDEITTALTAIGLEVEDVRDRGAVLAPFTVAHVVSAEQHPNADRLRLCKVDTGREVVQVVCGAPNARGGMKGVFAASGTTIPRTGMVLKPSEIRGVASNGMLCSAYEMDLSDDHDGIIELPEDAPVGVPFARLLGLDDPVIEIAITPNRADCLGVRGIARDLAARGLGRLIPNAVEPVPAAFTGGPRITIADEARSACPIFVGRLVRGVRNGPSPDWLQRRLVAIGLRPISALVDITNFLTFDRNRPLHVFDAAKLAGDLVIRPARAGETLQALNGKSYALAPPMTVIADTTGAISLGGVIGGEGTGCDGDTRDVLIEAAFFDPLSTARTGRALGILSDARYRFERGIDPASAIDGIEAATRLVLEFCGGEAGNLIVAGAAADARRVIRFAWRRVESLGAVAVPAAEQRRILEDLGFAVEPVGEESAIVTPPSWRADVEGAADLVEEVLRIHGYDRVPVKALRPETALPARSLTPGQRRASDIRRLVASRGLMEAVTFSFMARQDAERFGGGAPDLALANPIAADLDQMRPTPLGNLVQAARKAQDHGVGDVALFELGPAYRGPTPDQQALTAAGLRVGSAEPRHWRDELRPTRPDVSANAGLKSDGPMPRRVDVFDAKADLMAALAASGLAIASLRIAAEAPGHYHPGQSGTITLGPKTILGHFGALHPALIAHYGLTGGAVAFELMLDAVPQPRAKGGRARPVYRPSAFQPVSRDFAFLVDEAVSAEAVLRAARSAEQKLIAEVAVFDVYRGPGIPDGRKSLGLAVTLQPVERTLTDAEIEEVAARLVEAVTRATGAILRG